MTAQEDDSPLAAMISTIADGQPLTTLDQARLRLLMVDQAQQRGLSWAAIAAAFKYPDGRHAKRAVRGLREQVKRAERLGSLP